MFLEISQNSQEDTSARVSFLVKLQVSGLVFSCEVCEVSKNTFLHKHLWWLLPTDVVVYLIYYFHRFSNGLYATGKKNRYTNSCDQLTLPVPYISESSIEIKIKLNFCFHTSLWYLRRPLRLS